MMALHHHHHHHHHLSAAADYCRHFSAPPAIGYGDSGHYLPRLTGAEPMLKPPLSLFSHPQQPFPHLDPLPPLGPPPMGPTPGLCPGPPPNLGPPLGPAPAMGPPLTSAPALGPPVSLCPPPGHALVPPPLAPNSQMPPPPHLPPHFPPTPCREPTPSSPNVPPGLAPTPVSAQAAPEAEQPHGESSSMGSEEQDDTLGLDELCKPLYCKLCNVTLNSTQQAQAHYQGKNHSKKLRNFYAGREQPPAIRITDSDTSAQSNTGEGDTTRQLVFKGAARVILATENDYCKLCDASFSSVAVAQAHYQGKNHAKRMRLQEAHNNSESSSEVMPKRSRKEDYRLLKHRPQLPSPLTGPYFHARPRPRIPRDLAMCVTPSGSFYCSMCNSGAEQEPDFRQHLESKQHKAKVSELRYRNEMVTLGYS